jgi:hypothetical protein
MTRGFIALRKVLRFRILCGLRTSPGSRPSPVVARCELDIPTFVLHFSQMSTTLSVRLPEALARWVEENAKATGRSQGSLVKEALERVRQTEASKPFLRLAGSVDGPRNLSRRKGFSRS